MIAREEIRAATAASDGLLAPTAQAAEHFPGEPGIWVFVLGDMLVFGLFFSVFTHYRALDSASFVVGQAALSQNYGALNTVILLFSSWFVVMGVVDMRERDGRLAPRLIALAFLCGAAFVVVKFFEWGAKFESGIGITTSDFYMYYFIFTGLHLVHVLIGMGVLACVWHAARRGVTSARELKLVESGGIFWHMVDLLWILLFPLLYLMQ
jgi:nitric oxide reductase NorE protein